MASKALSERAEKHAQYHAGLQTKAGERTAAILRDLAAENAALRTERAASKRDAAQLEEFIGRREDDILHIARERDAATARAATMAAEVARLRGALQIYADGLCELGQSHECCGRLSSADCFGCTARAALAPPAPAPRDAAGGGA